MAKYFFILLLFFINAPCFSQVTVKINWQRHTPSVKSDTIYYSAGRKLTWADFKGKPDPQSDATAITSSGFGYAASMESGNGKTNIDITVYCYFSKSKSWVRTESNYALNHEQHHFDVTYIVTNLFIEKLKAAKFTRKNYDGLIEKIYNESCRQLEQMQNEYDGQTRNGRLKNVQSEWNEKIETQLGTYK
jgi:FtsZ-binding cell division protein ZapB